MVNKISSFLSDLGFSEEEAMVYQVLLEYGKLTVLELSRRTKINRTTLYRILERLTERKLIEEIIDEYKKLYHATGLHVLELLINEQKEKVTRLESGFPSITSLITSVKTSQPGTKVIFYRGRDGIQQMGWNTLQAKHECVGYTFREYEEAVGRVFAKKWTEEFIRRDLFFREIYSVELEKSKKEGARPITGSSPRFRERYIDPKLLHINHQMDIYNDVIAIYNWQEGEVFGVEIINEQVSKMHKQMFEIVWKLGKEIQ